MLVCAIDTDTACVTHPALLGEQMKRKSMQIYRSRTATTQIATALLIALILVMSGSDSGSFAAPDKDSQKGNACTITLKNGLKEPGKCNDNVCSKCCSVFDSNSCTPTPRPSTSLRFRLPLLDAPTQKVAPSQRFPLPLQKAPAQKVAPSTQ